LAGCVLDYIHTLKFVHYLQCSDPPGIAGPSRGLMRFIKPVLAVATLMRAIIGERRLRSKIHPV
jgi:hypothetical protein